MLPTPSKCSFEVRCEALGTGRLGTLLLRVLERAGAGGSEFAGETAPSGVPAHWALNPSGWPAA
jgi:hypothetical protein